MGKEERMQYTVSSWYHTPKQASHTNRITYATKPHACFYKKGGKGKRNTKIDRKTSQLILELRGMMLLSCAHVFVYSECVE